MKVIKGIGNVLGIIISLVLSIALVFCLMAAPVVSMVSLAGRPKAAANFLQDVMTNVDYKDLIRQNSDIEEFLEKEGLGKEFLTDAMASNTLVQIIECYAVDLSNMLVDPDADPELDQDRLEEIVDDNMDELVDIAKRISDSSNEKELEREIERLVRENGREFLDMLPTIEELDLDQLVEEIADETDMDEDLLESVLEIWLTGKLLWIFIGVCVVLALLIFLFRWGKFRGFFWMIFVCGIGAFLNVAVPLVYGLLEAELMEVDKSVAYLMDPVMQRVMWEFYLAAIILAAVAVVSLLVYVIGRAVSKKTEKKAEPEIPVIPGYPYGNATAPVAESAPVQTQSSLAQETPAPVVEEPVIVAAPVVEVPEPVAEAPVMAFTPVAEVPEPEPMVEEPAPEPVPEPVVVPAPVEEAPAPAVEEAPVVVAPPVVEAPAEPRVRYCTRCGTPYTQGAFCTRCGNKL